MEPKKYWWMSIEYIEMVKVAGGPSGGIGQKVVRGIVSDIHPFIYCKNNNRQLVTWKLISVEEYQLWNQLNNK